MKTFILTTITLLSYSFAFSQNCDGLASDIVVSTGYNPSTGTTLANYAFDPMWRLTQAPADPPGWTSNIGGPAIAVPLSSSWNLSGPNSGYINAYPTTQALTDNWNQTTTPYIFEREFCVCVTESASQTADVNFDLKLNADNWAELYLEDESGTQTLLLSQNYSYVTANFTGVPAASVNVTLPLETGMYKLKLVHRNKLVVMGVNLSGKIYSNGLLSNNICTRKGSIAGYTIEDQNSNGIIDSSDPKAQGWTMRLYDASNTLVNSIVTDHSGYYFFMDVTPGNYTVTAEGPAGWSVIEPISAHHVAVVDTNKVDVAEFLVIPEENPDQNPILSSNGSNNGNEHCDLNVPNVFTPDGNNVNDIFYFSDECNIQFEARIFNRWGNIIFETNSISNGWDGTDGKGNNLADGVYMYTVKAVYSNGEEKTVNGHITLIR